jgi:alkylation response protein AidB-like acyl-CoA dehydrogenase
VFAAVKDENGNPEGITCFYVPGNSKGIRRGKAVDKLGWRESNTGHIHFENVFVPAEHQLGKIGEGLKVLTHCLNRSKTLLGAVGVGLSYRALDLVGERLITTERYGKLLIEQPAIRHVLARLHTEVEAAWLLTSRAAAVWDTGDFAVKEASMAKLYSGNVASKVASQAIELFGARGFLNEYEVSRLVRDAKAIEIVEGPSLVQELLIAKKVLPESPKANHLYDLEKKDHEPTPDNVIPFKKKVA